MIVLWNRRTTVGLDIGSGFCRAATLQHGGSGPRLVNLAAAPNPVGTVVRGEVRDPERVAGILAGMFSRGEIPQREVVIGLGGGDVVSKRIEMDRMDVDEARGALPWEAEQHVPLDMEAVELDFCILDPDGAGPTMTVLLAAAPSELVERRVALLSKAGLRPAAIDLTVVALRNALEISHPPAMKGLVAVVEVRGDGTAVHLLDHGAPVSSGDLQAVPPAPGAGPLSPGVGPRLPGAGSLSPGAGSQSPGADPLPPGRPIHSGAGEPVAQPDLPRIGESILRAAELASATGRELGISSVYLCGAGATAGHLPERLADHLGIETHVAGPLAGLEAGPRVQDIPDLDEVAPAFLLPVGLGLRSP